MDIDKIDWEMGGEDIKVTSSIATVESDSERIVESDSSHVDGRSNKRVILTQNVRKDYLSVVEEVYKPSSLDSILLAH